MAPLGDPDPAPPGRPVPTDGVLAFFGDHLDGRAVAAAVVAAIDALGPHEVRVTRSQVSFGRRRGFAWLWRPGQYLRTDVPAVLSLALPRRDTDARWKQVAHPARTTWMHHLELRAPSEVDDQVRRWLEEAYASAG